MLSYPGQSSTRADDAGFDRVAVARALEGSSTGAGASAAGIATGLSTTWISSQPMADRVKSAMITSVESTSAVALSVLAKS